MEFFLYEIPLHILSSMLIARLTTQNFKRCLPLPEYDKPNADRTMNHRNPNGLGRCRCGAIVSENRGVGDGVTEIPDELIPKAKIIVHGVSGRGFYGSLGRRCRVGRDSHSHSL
jgi:hypothetical protein